MLHIEVFYYLIYEGSEYIQYDNLIKYWKKDLSNSLSNEQTLLDTGNYGKASLSVMALFFTLKNCFDPIKLSCYFQDDNIFTAGHCSLRQHRRVPAWIHCK